MHQFSSLAITTEKNPQHVESTTGKLPHNALTKYAKDVGADPNAFKIGDLAIPLEKYPNHNEFTRN